MIEFGSVSIVIPAFNEEKSLKTLLERISKVSKAFEVIVCSDGSTDQTASIAKEMGTRLIEHPYNIGNGASVKRGAQEATRPFLVFMDADLQHPPEDIPKLLDFLPEYDMVIGARTRTAHSSKFRNLGNYVLIKFAEGISGFRIDDLTSGFRAARKDRFLQFSHLYPLGYSYPTTSTLAFLCSGYFVKYVPLTDICERENGESKISPFRDGMRFLHIIIRVIMTFHPQKIFLPVSLITFLTGIGFSVFQLWNSGGIRSTGVILLLTSVIIFLNGLLAEQVSQMRLERNKDLPSPCEQEVFNKTAKFQK